MAHGFKPAVFKLKERLALLTSSKQPGGVGGTSQLELLIRRELQGRPNDENLWIKLLDNLVSQGKALEAYSEAFKLENRRELWPSSSLWYSALRKICTVSHYFTNLMTVAVPIMHYENKRNETYFLLYISDDSADTCMLKI
jgi:hypothetical protein